MMESENLEALRKQLLAEREARVEAQQRAEEAENRRQQEQRRAEEADNRRQQEQQRAEEAENRRQQEQQRAEEAENRTRATTLPEYVDGCHHFLFTSLAVQPDKSLTSKGSFTNPQHKRCPARLCPWVDFLDRQKSILGKLYSVYPVQSRAFESLEFLRGLGERVGRRFVSNEKDLELNQHQTVESPVTTIIEQLRMQSMGEDFDVGGGVVFENHPNVASDAAEEPRERQRGQTHSHPYQLRPDQICVYKCNKDDATRRRMAFFVEYKAPHKLTLPHLRLGLRDMDIYDEVVNRVTKPLTGDTEALFQYTSDKLVAAAVTQTYHYMIEGGLEYSYVTTGEAFIFLKIDWNEPGIVYYHLAEPSEEVRAHLENFRHYTSVSQVLAFTLLALASPVHGQDERHKAVGSLKTWNEDYDSILHAIPASERKQTPPQSAFQPRTYKHVDRSPYLLRKGKKSNRNTCRTPASRRFDDMQSSPETSDDESHLAETPTRPRQHTQIELTGQPYRDDRSGSTTHGAQSRPYCSQSCLLGLVQGENLDQNCPNFSIHRGGQHHQVRLGHPITRDIWLRLLQKQLAQTLDDNVEPLWIQGARGIMFKVTLSGYGYTVVAKGTVSAFVEDLQHEAAVYQQLRGLQGIYVPVFLGAVDLERPYYYDFQVRVIHMMFLSWGGDRIDSGSLAEDERQKRKQEVVCSVQAIHAEGILHKDIRTENVLWNEEVGRVMLIDFERAALVDPLRRPLLPASPNLKRKRSVGKGTGSAYKNTSINRMCTEIIVAESILHQSDDFHYR
jgi:predicted Ser/Thr protein kinase